VASPTITSWTWFISRIRSEISSCDTFRNRSQLTQLASPEKIMLGTKQAPKQRKREADSELAALFSSENAETKLKALRIKCAGERLSGIAKVVAAICGSGVGYVALRTAQHYF
jgi:hypothetical protein